MPLHLVYSNHAEGQLHLVTGIYCQRAFSNQQMIKHSVNTFLLNVMKERFQVSACNIGIKYD